MKLLKTILFIIISISFSGCYFLDYMIPEQYFEDDLRNQNNQLSYVWIYQPAGIQCQDNYFNSLQEALDFLENMHITVYDSNIQIEDGIQKCGYPTLLTYLVKIEKSQLVYANKYGWLKYIPPPNVYRSYTQKHLVLNDNN